MLLLRVALHHGYRPVAEHAAHLHVRQLIAPGRKRSVAESRIRHAAAVLDPVAAFDRLRRLLGRAQLASVFT